MRLKSWDIGEDKFLQLSEIKQLQSSLDNISITSVDDNFGRVYKNPTSGEQSKIYSLMLETGQKINLYIAKDGRVTRVEYEKQVFDSALTGGEVTTTPQEIAKLVKKYIFADQKQEALAKINKKDLDKLTTTISSEDDANLALQKQYLTVGSGRFIIVNRDDEFFDGKEWTKDNIKIATYASREEAEALMPEFTRLVRI